MTAATRPPALTGRSGLDNLPARCRPARLALLAAGDRDSLLGALRDLRARAAAGEPALPTPTASGAAGEHRLAVLASDAADLAEKLATAEARLAGPATRVLRWKNAIYYAAGPPPEGKTAFLFPGQGSQHPGMLDELCRLFPSVREWFADLDRTVADFAVPAPSLLAWPPAGGLTEEERAFLLRELYDLRGGAQLGVVANLALYDLAVDLGLRCDVMVGHSNGEHAALFASRAFRDERPGLLLAMRRMIEQAIADPLPAEPEAVLTVGLRDRSTLDRLIAAEGDGLYLAMINCPSQFVLAGRAAAIDRAAAALTREGGIPLRVPLERAYHTPLFAGWGRWLRRLYDEAAIGLPAIPLYCCMTAAPYPGEPRQVRDLAAAQWSNPVDFERTILRLWEDGARTFVEIGPDNKLKSFLADTLRGRDHLAVSTSSARHPAVEQMLRMVGELFVHGVALDFGSVTWRALAAAGAGGDSNTDEHGRTRTNTDAEGPAEPHLDILREHFALMQEFLRGQARVLSLVAGTGSSAEESVSSVSSVPPTQVPTQVPAEWPLLDRITRTPGRLTAERRFDLDRDPLLRHHCLGPAPSPSRRPAAPPLAVLPFTFSLEIAAEAALALLADRGAAVVTGMSAVRASRWLALDRGALTVAITAEATGAGRARVRLFQIEGGRQLPAFEAEVETAPAFPPPPTAPAARSAPVALAPTRLWSAEQFYRDYAFHGPAFHVLQRVHGTAGAEIAADLVVPVRPVPTGASTSPAFLLDPALLDGSGQLAGFWLLEGGRRDFGIFPFHLRSLRIWGPPPPEGTALAGRATVEWQAHGATRADVDFAAPDGRLLYRLEGLEQRYLALPPRFAGALLGSAARPRPLAAPGPDSGAPADREIAGLPHAFLAESWGVWSRALAHQVLAPAELDEWYERAGRDIPWLLSRAAAKEAVRAWAAARGLELAAADIELAGPAGGTLAVHCPELPDALAVEVVHDGERTAARLLTPVSQPR
jgi:malonyl CoA-acyl carrier protein transacylase